MTNRNVKSLFAALIVPFVITVMSQAVIAHPLYGPSSQIVDIQFGILAQRLAARRISLQLSSAAAVWLADNGYDPSFGARPLKRLMQKEIADRLALQLLEGRFSDGDTIDVVVDDDHLTFVAG
jgi:ATP-dependent Clp protease ATP-binding subunit ClpB